MGACPEDKRARTTPSIKALIMAGMGAEMSGWRAERKKQCGDKRAQHASFSFQYIYVLGAYVGNAQKPKVLPKNFILNITNISS